MTDDIKPGVYRWGSKYIIVSQQWYDWYKNFLKEREEKRLIDPRTPH